SWIASGSGERRATLFSASSVFPCSSPISSWREWWRSCAGSEPGAARGHAPRAARPASRGLLQRSPRLDARDQLHARVLRPDLMAAHPPAVRALLLRQLLPGRALGHAGPGRHHHGRRPPHGISARLAPRPNDEPLEAGAPRLRALPAPRGHRHSLLRLDDPSRRPRPPSLPGILAGSLLVFSLAIISFVVPILLGGFKVQVLPMIIYEQMLSVFDWPFGAANAFVLLVLSVILIALYIRATERALRG